MVILDDVKRRLGELAPVVVDLADALAIALCHANSARSLQFGKTKTRRQAMGYE